MLNETEFRELHGPVSFRPVISLAGQWLILIFGVYCLSLNSVAAMPLAFIIIIRQQLALSVMMHEGVHYSLSRFKNLNDFIGVFFCSGPILSHFHAYRQLHLQHHRFTLHPEKDPGQYLLRSAKSLRHLAQDAARDLLGITYFSLGSKANLGKLEFKMVVINLAGQIFGLILVGLIFKAFNVFDLFFLFWVLPLVTIHQLVLRIRALMEHGGLHYNSRAQLCTRTVKTGLLTKIMAPYNINFHIEHHLYPNLPGFKLPKVAKLASQKIKSTAFEIEENYIQAFYQIYKA